MRWPLEYWEQRSNCSQKSGKRRNGQTQGAPGSLGRHSWVSEMGVLTAWWKGRWDRRKIVESTEKETIKEETFFENRRVLGKKNLSSEIRWYRIWTYLLNLLAWWSVPKFFSCLQSQFPQLIQILYFLGLKWTPELLREIWKK